MLKRNLIANYLGQGWTALSREMARVGWGQGDAGAARLGTTEPGLGFR